MIPAQRCNCGPGDDCAECNPPKCGREGESDYGDYADGSTHWVTEVCGEYLCAHGSCPSCDPRCTDCPDRRSTDLRIDTSEADDIPF